MVKWIPDNFRIVDLVDQDRQDIAALKKMLERMSYETGLGTLSAPGKGARVANRMRSKSELGKPWNVYFKNPAILQVDWRRSIVLEKSPPT